MGGLRPGFRYRRFRIAATSAAATSAWGANSGATILSVLSGASVDIDDTVTQLAGVFAHGWRVEIVAAFVGGTVAIDVGVDADPTVWTGGGISASAGGAVGAGSSSSADAFAPLEGLKFAARVTVSGMGASLATLTAGAAYVYAIGVLLPS